MRLLRLFILASFFLIFLSNTRSIFAMTLDTPRFWQVQSIDTMKYSRDPSREFLGNLDETANLIDYQIRQIADTGATHVAIATPYDEEFLPILRLWVGSARRYGIKVWFRGNWSGWEEWFNYPKISRAEHLEKTKNFIISRSELFEDGDVFTSCPECENGGPGDPRIHTDPAGYTQFLIEEHSIVDTAFAEIGKKVITNYHSSNGDVARLIMTPETTKATGGVVTVDHYVTDPVKLANDLIAYAQNSQGKVVLGEFGAPIPDLHGNMSDEEQAVWLDRLFSEMVKQPDLIGLNYWTNVGGSTAIWKDDGTPKPAVEIIKKYFQPPTVSVSVKTITGQPVSNVTAQLGHRQYASAGAVIEIPYHDNQTVTEKVVFSAPGYLNTEVSLSQLIQNPELTLAWEPKPVIPSFLERLKWFLQSIFPFLR